MTRRTKPPRQRRPGLARLLLTLVLFAALPATWLWEHLARALAGEPALPFGGPGNRAAGAPSVPTDAGPDAVRVIAIYLLAIMIAHLVGGEYRANPHPGKARRTFVLTVGGLGLAVVAAGVLMMAAFMPGVPSRTLAVDSLELGFIATPPLISVLHGWRRGDSWADVELPRRRRRPRAAGAPAVPPAPEAQETPTVQPVPAPQPGPASGFWGE